MRLFAAQAYSKTKPYSALFPAGFLQETLHTLELLFPRYNKPTRAWLEREARSNTSVSTLDLGLLELDTLMSQNRTIEHFKFWRDELIELKERFEQPGETSLSQLWYDRRNKLQWITFWFGLVIAVATLLSLFIGVFQTGLGAVQVYKAYRPS